MLANGTSCHEVTHNALRKQCTSCHLLANDTSCHRKVTHHVAQRAIHHVNAQALIHHVCDAWVRISLVPPPKILA